MLKNYLLIGLRNLKKHLTYSIINVVGLSLGLATCLLLVIWINHELSYDSFHEKSQRIYRGSLEYGFGGQTAKTSVSPTALLPALKSFPEVEDGVRVYNPAAWSPFIVRQGENLFQEGRFYFADSTFFNVFSFPLIKGNPQKALTEPNSVVLTERTAQKYFGSADPLGKTLTVNNGVEYTVTGLMHNLPSNSMLQFDLLGSFTSLNDSRREPHWWSANYQTFLTLHPQAEISSVYERTNALVKEVLANEIANPGDYVRYNFVPLTDIYLRSEFDAEPEVVGDIKYVYIFSVIALMVLIIASINYVNLATARAAERAKEVGLRKVAGAVRQQLIAQFMGESFLITMLSFGVAFLLAQGALPFFNQLTGKAFQFSALLQPDFLLMCFSAMIGIAVISGTYPALVITSFKPVSVLKGNFKFSGQGIWLRKGLVIVQFSISVILIIGTFVILRQLEFIQSVKLGYEKENVIMLPYDRKTSQVYESLKTELLRSGAVTSVGRGNSSPVHVKSGYTINPAGNPGRGVMITGLPADMDYIPTVGIDILEGENFTQADLERATKDTVYTFILNETALATLHLARENAIGTPVEMGARKGTITGVIKDFHFSSLHNSIGPLVIFPEEFQLNHIFIKLASGETKQRLATIQTVCSTLIPHRPFDYEFVDQQYANLYQAEDRMGSIFTVFAALAIVIACLGLFGLVSFSAAQKTKEISIRKVLGASPTSIMMLITRDFTPLVVIAILIGLPTAWWAMHEWLSAFAYKVDIGMGPLLIASLLCIVIAFATAGYQAVKAAFINPADTLRNE